MSDFTLDTSGAVYMPRPTPNTMMPGRLEWSMLSPFEQGYVEAMFASPEGTRGGKGLAFYGHGFRNLAPETLAAIRKDCARYEAAWPPHPHDKNDAERGRRFWHTRQRGMYAGIVDFLPLTVTLGDDGRVYLREAGQ